MAAKADPPLKLLDAFRVILRALYPKRPGLADEIQDIRWFHYPRRHRVPPEERDAANKAREVLTKNVRELNIGLIGVLKGISPQEPHAINPIACASGELNMWENTLEVEEPLTESEKKKVFPVRHHNVWQVHAVAAADINRIVRSLAGEAPFAGRFTAAELDALVTQYRVSNPRPSQRGCEAAAKRMGKAFDRKELRKLYNAAATREGQAVTPGRPRFRYSPN
jgi:hypothetical protein